MKPLYTPEELAFLSEKELQEIISSGKSVRRQTVENAKWGSVRKLDGQYYVKVNWNAWVQLGARPAEQQVWTFLDKDMLNSIEYTEIFSEDDY